MPILAKIEITINETGMINVSGCLENKLMAYGMLLAAHDVIKDHNDAKQKSLILAVPAGSAEFLASRQ